MFPSFLIRIKYRERKEKAMNHKIKIISVLALLFAAGLFGVFALKRSNESILLPKEGKAVSGLEAENAGDAETIGEADWPGKVPEDAFSGNEDTPAPANTEPLPVLVHVCGEVLLPGVYALPPESRVYEAVEKAGGFTEEADTDALNLAGPLSDGAKIYVPAEGETNAGHESEGLSGETAEKVPSGTVGTVNINTATKEELMSLSGIGESKAEAILQYRESSGPFQNPSDIMNVKGIGEGMYQKIKDRITTG